MVGAHLLYGLVLKGYKVRALRRPSSNLKQVEKIFSFYKGDYFQLFETIEWVEGDILDKEGLRGALNGIDQIYNAAALISFDPEDRDNMLYTNCEGTANLVDLALELRIPRFCHVSSIAAIGSPPEGIVATEDQPWRNSRDHSGYSESKYVSEMTVWRGILEGLDAVIVNPSIILGPWNWKSGSSVIFSRIRKGMKFYTKGGTGFVDVRDVTAAMVDLMADSNWETLKNQRYILNAENIAYRDLFDKVATELNVKPPDIHADNMLLNLAWRLSAFYKFITGIKPSITKDSARSAGKLSYYDGTKICHCTGFKYTPVDVTIHEIAQIFLKEVNKV